MQISTRECDVFQFIGVSEVYAVWICGAEGVIGSSKTLIYTEPQGVTFH